VVQNFLKRRNDLLSMDKKASGGLCPTGKGKGVLLKKSRKKQKGGILLFDTGARGEKNENERQNHDGIWWPASAMEEKEGLGEGSTAE